MSTIKLYDLSSYDTTCTATLLSAEKKESPYGNYSLIFDRTVFFPEAGGQISDRGYILISDKEYAVTHVSIDAEDVIRHFLSTEDDLSSLTGTECTLTIDRALRFSLMQQHTGEHILSGIAHSVFGLSNVGFHLSENTVTADYDRFLTDEEAEKLETLTNKAIFENRSVTCSYPGKEELETLPFRSKTEFETAIRITDIEGIDRCACCAPHVRATGEVGLLKIIGKIRYKGGSRLTFVCGARAVAYFNLLQTQAGELSRLLSAEREALFPAVESLITEKESLRVSLKEAKKKLLFDRINVLSLSGEPLYLFVEDADMGDARTAVNLLSEKTDGYSAIFSGSDTAGYSYILGSKTLDCGIPGKLFRENFGAKGGGKKEMIQGFVKAEEAALRKALTGLL